MHYYRYSNPEISCWYKYLLFSYNIIFWVSTRPKLSFCSMRSSAWDLSPWNYVLQHVHITHRESERHGLGWRLLWYVQAWLKPSNSFHFQLKLEAGKCPDVSICLVGFSMSVGSIRYNNGEKCGPCSSELTVYVRKTMQMHNIEVDSLVSEAWMSMWIMDGSWQRHPGIWTDSDASPVGIFWVWK